MSKCICCQGIYYENSSLSRMIEVKKANIYFCKSCFTIAMSTASSNVKDFIRECRVHQGLMEKLECRTIDLYNLIQYDGVESIDFNQFKADVIEIEIEAEEFINYIDEHRKEVEAELMLIGFKKELTKSTYLFSRKELIDVFGIKTNYITKYKKLKGYIRSMHFNKYDINEIIKLQKEGLGYKND